jgi:hypothetical protein
MVTDRLAYLLDQHRDALNRAEKSEHVYAAVVAQHRQRAEEVRGRSQGDADVRASSDARLRTAISDGQYYRDKATMYGIAVLVERAVGETC